MMNRFFSFLAVLIAVVSCNRDQIAAIYDGESGFSFAAGVLNVEVSASDEGKVMVPVFRGSNSMNAAEISFRFDASDDNSSSPVWVAEDPEGNFSLVSKRAVFADNSFSSNVQVRFKDVESLNPGRKYRMKLFINRDASPSGRDSVIVTVSRKLTFVKYGDAEYMDYCIFDNAYPVEIFKAQEAAIFRVMDPYSEGLVAEEYASEGLVQAPPSYVQFKVQPDGSIYYEPFSTGMIVPAPNAAGMCMAWVYHPSDYLLSWGHDFSIFIPDNKQLSEKEFQLVGVYCLPGFSYGFLNEGAYKISIKVK